MKYQAIIFDLDGVICFTDEYHYLAWQELADRVGVHFDRTINNRLRGVSRMESLAIVLERYDGPALSDEEKQRLAEEKNTRYRGYLEQMSPDDLSQETRQTLEQLRGAGLRLAIGSSSRNAPLILKRIGLDGYFDVVVDGNCITNSKPHPEVFQKAADRLGVNHASCLVVEDAVAGVQAGHGAGMEVAALGDAASVQAGDYNLTSFDELLSLAV